MSSGIFLSLLFLLIPNPKTQGISVIAQDQYHVDINYKLTDFSITLEEFNGHLWHRINIAEVSLPNKEGMPNIPSFGRYIAIPQGASARVTIVSHQTEIFHNIDLAPSPNIPAENDGSPLRYEKDINIYGRNAYYPDQPAILSPPAKIRGVDVIVLSVTPFQYNSATKDLVIYKELRLRVDFVAGNGHFGENRLRSRHWEPILKGHLLNYNLLPKIDFFNPFHRDGYEYIIIVPDDSVFERWADTVKLWRQLQGISTGIFTLSQVGGNTVTAIESFIDSAYNNWSLPPSAVLLLSDFETSGKSYGITSMIVHDPYYGQDYASDNWYADVDGDTLPDLAIARICAQTGTHLSTMINKLLRYERQPYTDPVFYDRPLVCGAYYHPRWYQLTSEILRGFHVSIQNKNPFRLYNVYSGMHDTTWSAAPNTELIVAYFGESGLGYIPDIDTHNFAWWNNASTQSMIDTISAGNFLVQHRGIGYNLGWTEPVFRKEHLPALTNTEYPFVISICNETGRFNWNQDCFIEAFLRMQYGALGAIAASGVNYSFVSDVFNYGIYDGLWTDFDPYYPVFELIGYPDLRPGFANVSGKYYLASHDWAYCPQYKTIIYGLYHMFGDAFTTLYSEVPQNLTVVHAPFVYWAQTYFTVQADDSSIIALTVNGEIHGVAEGNGLPQDIPITALPPPGNVMKITVTKANHLRYQENVTIVSTYNGLILRSCIVDDSIGGNNDGQVNPGETIDYGIWIANIPPPDTVYSVYALLFTSDSYITLNTDSSWFGDIPDDSILSNPFYNFSVAGNCPNGHNIQFTLETHDIDDSVRCFYPCVTVFAPANVKEKEVFYPAPTESILKQPYPDPCLDLVCIRYQLPHREKIQLNILDATGRRIRELVNKIQDPGHHSIMWDINDKYKRRVANGVYFVQLIYDNHNKIRKIVVLK